MFKFYLYCFVFYFLSLSSVAYEEEIPIEHKQDLSIYINKFCKGKGRSYVRIQNNLIVDCLTANTLWKIDYADNWQAAMINALFYGIYDDYLGDEEYAPKPGVVLVQEDSDDYRSMVQLKQIVNHYKLPINLNIIENYASNPASDNRNMQIEFGKHKFLIIGD